MKFDRLMEQLIGVAALLVLAGGTMIVVAPFITALLWGSILAYCTWHPFLRLAALFGGRRVWAALLIVLVILGVVLVPIFYGGLAFSTYAPDIASVVQQRIAAGLPPVPDWMIRLPVIGPRIDDAWTGIVARNPEALVRARELSGTILRTVLVAGLAVVHGLGLLALSVVFTAYFYLHGENTVAALRAAMLRIAGSRTDYLLGLIGGTVKGVVYGILGTALAQAILSGVGYWIAGLPSPGLLGLATFFLAIIPGGTVLVFVPGAIWLAQGGQTGWAVFLVVWSVVVGIAVDNVLKPLLIGKSSRVPIILIMIGVIGGALAYGLLGAFIGPTLMAVGHAVLRDWTSSNAVQGPDEEAVEAGAAQAPRPAM